ncbi:MAG: ATP-binding protein [Deltaproteobacteria bacterium]|nr:ATP-binding protein [Deltaproteobacteria bacterium]
MPRDGLPFELAAACYALDMTITKSIEQLSADDLRTLVADGVRESRLIEYKESLPAGTDDAKKEFLADISSFANASGGHLVYGVTERRDAAGKPTGIPEKVEGLTGVNADAEIRRLEDLVRAGLEPRIIGIRLRAVDGFAAGPCIVVRVPRSWAAPHMVKLKGSSRFFARNSAGKYQLDVAELRAAFVLSESWAEKLRSFQRERVARILADETPIKLKSVARMVLHLIPATAFDPGQAVDVVAVGERPDDLRPLYSMGGRHRFNVDGIVTFTQAVDEDRAANYTQLFRSGAIEAVDAQLMRSGKVLWAVNFEQEMIEGSKRYVGLLERLGVSPPIAVLTSVLRAEGFELGVDKSRYSAPCPEQAIDRSVLWLPDVLVTEYAEFHAETVLRPVFDTLWQAAGWKRSHHYDATGTWAPPR